MRASGSVRRTFRVQASSSTPPKGPVTQVPYTSRRWTWKGHDIRMEEWRDLLVEFVQEFIDEPVVLVGNSIGSLACVMASAELGDQVKAMALLNCSGGMNNKAVADDWRLKVIYPALKFVDYLLSIKWLAKRLFDGFRSRDNIKSVLSSVYIDKESVDDELVDLIYNPSCDEGALETFVTVRTMKHLHSCTRTCYPG
eukprot:jgi/Pico_ML_1/55885/g1502.t2